MTIIAWDGITLAADKQSTFEGLARTTTKIRRARDGSLMGAAGETAMCEALRRWYCAGQKVADFPDNKNQASLLVIRTDKSVLFWDSHPVPIRLEDPFTAMGSGRDYAIAAMYLKQDAAQAVKVACLFNTSCGMGIDTLRLNP